MLYNEAMAIKDTSKDIHKRLIEPVTSEQDSGEESLRPKKLADYIGQTMIKKHLQVALDSAKIRNSNVEHILFY